MSSLDTAVKQHEVTHKCSHILCYNKQCCPAAAVIVGDFIGWLVVQQQQRIMHMALNVNYLFLTQRRHVSISVDPKTLLYFIP